MSKYIEIEFVSPGLLAMVNKEHIVYVHPVDGGTCKVKLLSEKEPFIAKKSNYLDEILRGKI